MRASATEILRAHCIERRRRRGIASASLDGTPHTSAPRLSHEAWVDSLALVADVPETTLALVEEWYCGEGSTQWATQLVEVQGQEHEVRREQVAVPLRLTEAAARVGLMLGYKQCRDLLREAVSRVDEKLVQRAGRSEG